MKETLQFQCYNCSGTFYNRVDLTEKPTLLLECPYCGVRCAVTLSTTADSNDTILVIRRDGQRLTLNLNQATTTVIPTYSPE